MNKQTWDFVYESEDLQVAYSRFQGVIDVHFKEVCNHIKSRKEFCILH